MLALYLFVSIVAGTLTSVFSSDKHRNPFGWFVIGFLLPLIGFILVLVLPDNTPAPTQAETRQPSYLDDLQKLADLRDRGVLTADEFDEKKRLVLDRSKPGAAIEAPASNAVLGAADETEAKLLLATAQQHHFAKAFDEARRQYDSLVTRFPSSKQATVARQQIINLKSA